MEKDNKKKVTPDINEEMMMNLMVDGVKKDGLQLPPEPAEEQVKEDKRRGAAGRIITKQTRTTGKEPHQKNPWRKLRRTLFENPLDDKAGR